MKKMTQDRFPKTEFQKEREQWWENFGKEHESRFHFDMMDGFVILVLLGSIIAFAFIGD